MRAMPETVFNWVRFAIPLAAYGLFWLVFWLVAESFSRGAWTVATEFVAPLLLGVGSLAAAVAAVLASLRSTRAAESAALATARANDISEQALRDSRDAARTSHSLELQRSERERERAEADRTERYQFRLDDRLLPVVQAIDEYGDTVRDVLKAREKGDHNAEIGALAALVTATGNSGSSLLLLRAVANAEDVDVLERASGVFSAIRKLPYAQQPALVDRLWSILVGWRHPLVANEHARKSLEQLAADVAASAQQ